MEKTTGKEQTFAVLVVDDDAAVLEATIATLGTRYSVTGTTNPLEAIRLLKRRTFHVVVADWQMPAMDGLTFFEEVAKLPMRVSCLLMSGHIEELVTTEPPDRRRLLGFLAKPFAPAQLLERVEHFARLAAMKQSVHSMTGGASDTKR